MKLNKNFIVHSENGQTLLAPTAEAGFSGIVRGNKTLGAILGLLENEITEAEIVRALGERFEADDGVIQADVASVLEQLRGIGAIDEWSVAVKGGVFTTSRKTELSHEEMR